MKKTTFPVILTAIILAALLIVSCAKDKYLYFPDAINDGDAPLLKSSMVKGENLSPMEMLGKNLYFDKISIPNSMACSDCHAPKTGFTGPLAGINIHGSVYRGADAQMFGNRKPPSAAYAQEHELV